MALVLTFKSTKTKWLTQNSWPKLRGGFASAPLQNGMTDNQKNSSRITRLWAQSHVGAHEWTIKHFRILIQNLNYSICCHMHIGNKGWSIRKKKKWDIWSLKEIQAKLKDDSNKVLLLMHEQPAQPYCQTYIGKEAYFDLWEKSIAIHKLRYI